MVSETAHVTTVIVHGAGSTGAAAASLVGARPEAVLLEDRTGDVQRVAESIEATLASREDCTSLVGVSLGAHAVALWASRTRLPLPHLACVLPAWMGQPAAAAAATAASARAIAVDGATGLLTRLAAQAAHDDVIDLLRLAWSDYDDATLVKCLLRASEGRGPSANDLASIPAPVTVVGWRGDDLHPASLALEWASHLQRPIIVMAARPEIRLLQRALATAPGMRPVLRP